MLVATPVEVLGPASVQAQVAIQAEEQEPDVTAVAAPAELLDEPEVWVQADSAVSARVESAVSA